MLDGLLTAVFIRTFHNPQGVYQSDFRSCDLAQKISQHSTWKRGWNNRKV